MTSQLRCKISPLYHLLKRRVVFGQWLLDRNGFADTYAANSLPFTWAQYGCPIINHPNQTHLLNSKVENMKTAVETIDSLVFRPGQIFSFWRHIGRPTAQNGFLSGPTFVNGKIETSIGGGLCQISGLLFNLWLEAGLTVQERHSHTIDAYGDRRYLPLGRDATVAWPSKDLILKNCSQMSVQIKLAIDGLTATGSVLGEAPIPHHVSVAVQNSLDSVQNGQVIREVHIERNVLGTQSTSVAYFTSQYRLLGEQQS